MPDEHSEVSLKVWASPDDKQMVKDFKDTCPRGKISATLLALLRLYLAMPAEERGKLLGVKS